MKTYIYDEVIYQIFLKNIANWPLQLVFNFWKFWKNHFCMLISGYRSNIFIYTFITYKMLNFMIKFNIIVKNKNFYFLTPKNFISRNRIVVCTGEYN